LTVRWVCFDRPCRALKQHRTPALGPLCMQVPVSFQVRQLSQCCLETIHPRRQLAVSINQHVGTNQLRRSTRTETKPRRSITREGCNRTQLTWSESIRPACCAHPERVPGDFTIALWNGRRPGSAEGRRGRPYTPLVYLYNRAKSVFHVRQGLRHGVTLGATTKPYSVLDAGRGERWFFLLLSPLSSLLGGRAYSALPCAGAPPPQRPRPCSRRSEIEAMSSRRPAAAGLTPPTPLLGAYRVCASAGKTGEATPTYAQRPPL